MGELTAGYGPERQAELFESIDAEQGPEIPLDYESLKQLAEECMDDFVYEFVAGGAGRGETMRANRTTFSRWRILPRMLRDTSDRSLEVEVGGRTLPTPITLSPIGVQTLYASDGELATARAAAALDVPQCVSTVSSMSFESVAEQLDETPRWAQFYLTTDDAITASFIERVENAGYDGIMVTVDTPYTGWRTRLQATGQIPMSEQHGVANFFEDPAFRDRLERPPESDPERAIDEMREISKYPELTWRELKALTNRTSVPVFVKGVLHPADARRAVEFADGIVVSNHGGRQIDGEVGALEMLPAIADAVGNAGDIVFDSGIRSGADVLKAIALGADAVGLGRPYIFALAAGGEEGVRELLKNVHAEFDLTLALAGFESPASVTGDAVVDGHRLTHSRLPATTAQEW